LKKKFYIRSENNKLLGLEIVRFLSAIAVLLWHYQLFFWVKDKPIDLIIDNLPFYTFFNFFYSYGLHGVIVFWGISGFIFFWKYQDLIHNKKFGGEKFFIFRFSRLYPLHILTLIIVLLLQEFYLLKNGFYYVYQTNDLKHFLLQILFASNWGFENDYSFNGPIWSVSAEVFSYLIFFLSIKKFGQSLLPNIFIIVFCILLRIFKLSNPVTDCLTIFFVCGCSAIIFKIINLSYYKKVINIFFFILAIIIPYLIIIFDLSSHKHFIYSFEFLYIPLILWVFAIELDILKKFRSLIEVFGNMTYSSYLLHFPLQLLISVICIYSGIKIDFYSNIFFIIYIFLILLLSYLIFSYFENPLKKIIRSKFYK
jgi:peptidoglycan/LPS O-acetylase OafA/YrhL